MEVESPIQPAGVKEVVDPKNSTGDKTSTTDDRTGPEHVEISLDDTNEKTVHVELEDNKDREGKDEGETDYKEKKIEEQDEKKDVEKPLIDENETVTIDLGNEDKKLPGEDTPTLPISDKNKPLPDDDEKKKEKAPSMFLHPIDTLRHAWKNSKSIPEFFLRAIFILFGSIGWVFCVGGVPFLPLVMLIIGSIFVHDCPVEPRIPVYLVVAGLFGLIQHVSAVVTKYIPKDKRGLLEAQRRRCMCLEGILQTFLFIWFIAGCVWVYGIYEPEYDDTDNPEYCHKTVYLFTFWMFNLSFILLCSFVVFAFCVVICVVTSSKKSP